MEYRVTWTIDLDAESIEDEARQAREIQLDPDSLATHFIVRDRDGGGGEIWTGQSDPCEHPARGIDAAIYVCVPMEEGIVRDVRAFTTESSARQAEAAWLTAHGLTEAKLREEASDWGTGIAIWECDLKP